MMKVKMRFSMKRSLNFIQNLVKKCLELSVINLREEFLNECISIQFCRVANEVARERGELRMILLYVCSPGLVAKEEKLCI